MPFRNQSEKVYDNKTKQKGFSKPTAVLIGAVFTGKDVLTDVQ